MLWSLLLIRFGFPCLRAKLSINTKVRAHEQRIKLARKSPSPHVLIKGGKHLTDGVRSAPEEGVDEDAAAAGATRSLRVPARSLEAARDRGLVARQYARLPPAWGSSPYPPHHRSCLLQPPSHP